MGTAAFLGGGAELDDVLDPGQEVLVDECPVASVDVFALVGHVAEVVAVAHISERLLITISWAGWRVVGQVRRPRP